MPKYKVRTKFRRLQGVNHATTVLARTGEEEWAELYKPTIRRLMTSTTGPKIKQSSYQLLLDTRFPIELVPHLENEAALHNERNNSEHAGGGIHEALGVVTDAIANDNGDFSLGPDKGHRELTSEERDYAHLVQLGYKDSTESYNGWDLMPELNSRYGSWWRNEKDDRVVLAVRGSKNLRDMWQNTKILAGSTSVQDEGLYDSIKKFQESYPKHKWDAVSHSLGSEILMNGIEKYDFDPAEVILINPGSSPFQPKEHIRRHIANPAVKMFLNTLSSTYAQLLEDADLNRVVFSPKSPGRLKVHSLSQWL